MTPPPTNSKRGAIDKIALTIFLVAESFCLIMILAFALKRHQGNLDIESAATHSPLAALAATPQESALLYAIGQVESGGNYSAVSNYGNHFGRYQMSNDLLLGLWGQPQLTPDVQDALAYTHLLWLEKQEGGFDVAELAKAWRGRDDADYVQRVENLYVSKINNQ